jgi:hypothetical protein
MARDPGSLWSPLPESGKQGTHVKTQFIVHSTGDRGSATAIFGYFSRAEVVVESTFVIGLTPADRTRQMLDTAEVADANLNANGPAISVETVGQAGDPFPDWQVSELIRIGRWARTQHPIDARICPSATASGFGWHVMFGSPGPWTPVAKDCPGKTRIQQLREQVFPAIFATQEDDMYEETDRKIAFDRHTQLSNELTAHRAILLQLAAKSVDVDEAQVAHDLAPILAPLLVGQLDRLTLDQLQELLQGAINEHSRRLAAALEASAPATAQHAAAPAAPQPFAALAAVPDEEPAPTIVSDPEPVHLDANAEPYADPEPAESRHSWF